MDETRLVAAAAAGDERAAGALYRRYEGVVRSVVRDGAGESGPDDLSQEVWLRVFASLSRFRGDCAFSTWLYRVARNVAASAGRRAAVRPELVAVSVVETAEDAPGRMAPAAGDVPLRIDLTRALSEVPPGMRRVLWLHDVEGWTHAEIGERLGIAEGTSKSQLFKGRARLRTVLAQREEGARSAA